MICLSIRQYRLPNNPAVAAELLCAPVLRLQTGVVNNPGQATSGKTLKNSHNRFPVYNLGVIPNVEIAVTWKKLLNCYVGVGRFLRIERTRGKRPDDCSGLVTPQ
jgi:hypothetical protein